MRIIDNSFKGTFKNYITQSLLATVALAIILYFVKVLTHAAIVASLGASTFIVFAMPHWVTARPRRLIGGHVVGILSGTICYYAFLTGPIGRLVINWEFATLGVYALAVGLSLFLMALTNTEHPPAAGTALGIVVQPWSYQIVIFVLVSVISLAIIRRLLSRYLRDLI
jgi:CBS-domain-containing membrane protein